MSKHHIEKVTCPSCHHEGDFEVWDSINTVLDPEMKEKYLISLFSFIPARTVERPFV